MKRWIVGLVVVLGGVGQTNAAIYTVVDLTPSGFEQSIATNISGTQQVGYGTGPPGLTRQALLWSGTAASAVSLNSSGFDRSIANGISGTQQVGFGNISSLSPTRALLWSGTAASAVDLNPSGYNTSDATDTNGTQQVGSVFAGHYHAFLWSGTAASAVDLNQFLPSEFISSEAYGIDAQGNVVGVAYTNQGYAHAVLWSAVPHPNVVPEPSPLIIWSLLGTLAIGVGWWRKRKRA